MANKNDVLTRARANLVLSHPFFGSLALRLKMVETTDPRIDTAATDGRAIYYNKEWVSKLTVAKATGLLAHECMHPAMLHQTRRGSRHPKKWNVACDYAINNILVDARFELPDNGCVDPQYRGMSAEEIYAKLPDPPGGWDAQGNDPGGCGGVLDAPGSDGKSPPSSSELAEAEAEWKVALAQAAHTAKQQGKLPGGMERLIDATLEAKIPWRQTLHQFFNDPQPADVSWKRPNRRFVYQGLYLPSRDTTNSGEIVIAIDTSGSIGEKELNEFGSEIKGIVDQVKPTKTTVIYCDARIAHVDEFLPGDELTFGAHGGGGTDFRPPFDYLAENDIRPKAFVYLTDGYGPFPEEQDFPVLWCINNNDVTPPHGQHLVLEV